MLVYRARAGDRLRQQIVQGSDYAMDPLISPFKQPAVKRRISYRRGVRPSPSIRNEGQAYVAKELDLAKNPIIGPLR